MIQHSLAAFLLGRPNIAAIVGVKVVESKAGQEDDPPFINYAVTGGDKFYHTQGESDLAEAFITLTCRAKSDLKASQLYEVLRDELSGFRGTWGDYPISGAFLSTPNSVSEADQGKGNDTGFPAVRGLLTVHYKQPVPTFGAT